jgi:small subunit ribosomal protein S20
VAHSFSAKKRVRQNEKQRVYNRSIKSELKGEMKDFLQLIHDHKLEEAKNELPKAFSLIDQDVAKGVIHRNTADRRKSRLARAVAGLEKHPAGGHAQA